MTSRITFVGGAEEVTGSNFLLDAGSAQLMIDCGARESPLSDQANEPFPYDVTKITALLVTHAHQDHIGRIPELVRHGFRGAIYSTAATKDLAAVMLNDALGIIEEEARRAQRVPPYEGSDIERALSQWETHRYHEAYTIADLSIEMLDSGHILGGAMMKISRGGRSVLFTGDIGNSPEPLLRDTESPEGVQYLVMESVYGDRTHENRERRKQLLREAVEETHARKGTLLIPSFSVERTQVLLSEMNDLVEREGMAALPVYLDSPLAAQVTTIFRKHTDLFNDAVQGKLKSGDDIFSFKGLVITDSARESLAIHREAGAKIIIAGAGMSNGGRVRMHEAALLDDKNTMLLFSGYQAPGSLGRRLQEGAKKVRIDDTWVKVRAEIRSLTGYSGHADRDQLLSFLELAGEKLERAFVVMGEPRSSLFFAQRAHDFLGVDAYVPHKGESIEITI